MTSSGFPSTDIQQTHTQTASCHINHTDTRDPSQSGNKPANTTYALPPTRLKARSLKASLGLPRSSLCTLDDPGRPVSQQVPCSSVHARVCWDLEVRAALLNPARTHAHTHTHRSHPFPLLTALHLAGSKAGLLHSAPGTTAKSSISTVPSLGPKPCFCGVRDAHGGRKELRY